MVDKLPQWLQPRAKRALHEMMYAERSADCEAARLRFEAGYQAKADMAIEKLNARGLHCECLSGVDETVPAPLIVRPVS